MAILIADRVQETSTSPGGTGTLTLTGSPVPGYKSFANGIGTGNSLYYTVYDAVTYAWEVGIGSWSANVLTRTTVLSNSLNTTAFISFTNGNTLNVWVDYPANAAVLQTDVGTNPNQIPLNQYLGKLAFEDVVDTISNNPYYDTAISDVQPTLNLDFVNSKTLDSRITFTRSTTATYYDGKSSAVAEQNLLTYSQDFTQSSWTKSNVTNTANSTTAPDGTTTASLITPIAGTLNKEILVTGNFLVNQVNTVSFYVKQNTQQFVQILIYSATSQAANFDLTNGTSQNLNSGVSTITSVGSSWYRITLSFTPTVASSNISLAVVDSLASARASTTASVNTFFIWGAQLEQRASATAYNATTTTALTNYIPVLQTAPNNVARLDYNPVTGTPNGLLIEESRANLVTYSQDFTNAAWAKTNQTISAAANIAPDGTQTANLITPTTTSGFNRFISAIVAITTSTNASHFIYVKPSGYTKVALRESNNTGDYVSFDISAGTILDKSSAATGSISSVGNGWYRIQATLISGNGNERFSLYILSPSYTSGNPEATWTPNGTSGVYAWGAQLEAGAFPTSYIPTVASQVTRSADSASMTGTNLTQWWNSSQGTFYCDSVGQFTSTTSGTSRNWVSGNASSSNLLYTNAGSNTLLSYDGISVGNTTGITNLSAQNKIALVYSIGANSKNNFANGVSGQGGTMTSAWTLNTTLNFGAGYSGWFKKISYYPQALSSAEIMELTA